MVEKSGEKRTVSNEHLFFLGLVQAVVGNVLFHTMRGGLEAWVAVTGEVMAAVAIGRWVYARFARRR
jgi:hypothetical protein